MDATKQYNIALVLYTQGIDYDDRIRKEILSTKQLYPNINFKIFAVEPKNREEDGISSYGIPYRTPYLKSRDKYSSGTHTIIKAWNFYKTIKKDLKSYDAVWCADIETIFFVFLVRKPLLWDLHELPTSFIGSPVKKAFFKYLERKVKVMIHANEARLNYLIEQNMVCHPEKQFVLRNYPQFNEIDPQTDITYESFVEWLGKSKCVYLQGISGADRADIESISAVLQFDSLKAVVVGRISPERKSLMEERFGKETLKERVFFTGLIKQLKTPQYIKKCYLSLVFYKKTSMNNWYCEPNRLFQSVINGIPVVVGNNPPLKGFVEKHSVGVSTETDGTDESEIAKGIKKATLEYKRLKSNVAKLPNNLLWHSQDGEIKKIVKKLFE